MNLNWYHMANSTDGSLMDLTGLTEQDLETLKLFNRDPWEPVDSSFIMALAYYSGAGVLEVKMKNGKVYTFMGVPEKIYEEFKKAPSKGRFFNEIIRQHFVSD